MTPEREKMIRRYVGISDNPPLRELLAELDSVRAERDSLKQDNAYLKMRLCNHCLREVDDPTAAKLTVELLTTERNALFRQGKIAEEALRCLLTAIKRKNWTYLVEQGIEDTEKALELIQNERPHVGKVGKNG